MNKISKTLSVSALGLSQFFTNVSADEAPDYQLATLSDNDFNSELIISAGSECLSYGAFRKDCDKPGLNIEFETKKDIWRFRFEGDANPFNKTESDIYGVSELTFGLQLGNFYTDAGFFNVDHPVIAHFDDIEQRHMAPMTLDNSLRRQSVNDQIGIAMGYNYQINDKWSASLHVAATQSKFVYISHDLSPDLYGRENVFGLAHANDLYPQRHIDELSRYKDLKLEDYSLSDLMQGKAPQLTINGEKASLPNIDISDRGKNFAVFASWIYLEHSNGWRDISRSVDTDKLAERYNKSRDDIVDSVNGLELPSNFREKLLEKFDGKIPEEFAQDLEDKLQNALGDLKSEANATKGITAQQIQVKLDDVIADLKGQLNDEIQKNPEKYYRSYRDTVRHLQDTFRSYQTVSDKPSYHANFEIMRDGESVDWRLGTVWNHLASGNPELADEERYGMYSILDWQINKDWAYQNVFSANYYRNHLGIEGFVNGTVLLYNRLSYDFNENFTAYAAAGASAEAIDGAFISTELGGQYCKSFLQNSAKLCASAAYEESLTHDIVTKEEMNFGSFRGNGAKFNLSFQMGF